MQNFRTLGLIIKKVRDLFILTDKYGKIIRCGVELEMKYVSSVSFYQSNVVWKKGRPSSPLMGETQTFWTGEQSWWEIFLLTACSESTVSYKV